MTNIVYINPYAFAGCTDDAPEGVYHKAHDGTNNKITLQYVTSGDPQTKLVVTNGDTIDYSGLGAQEPMFIVLATAEQSTSSGDAATAWSWAASISSGGGAIIVQDPAPSTVEDLDDQAQLSIIVEDAENGVPEITIVLTSSNCGGSDASTAFTFNFE